MEAVSSGDNSTLINPADREIMVQDLVEAVFSGDNSTLFALPGWSHNSDGSFDLIESSLFPLRSSLFALPSSPC